MSKRPIRIEGELAYIPLTRGYEAIIDAADVPLVEGYSWSARPTRRANGTLRTVYAAQYKRVNGKNTKSFLHRFILSAPDGFDVDHVDGNGLNNTRANIRICTKAQNSYNRILDPNSPSGVKGVRWRKDNFRWEAYIKVDGRQIAIGQFTDFEVACARIVEARQQFHGEFGRQA